MPCERQVDFFINQPVHQVFGYLSTFPVIAEARVNWVDSQNFRIHLSKELSFLSWGETITLSFFDPMNGGTRIIAHSKPKLPTILIDYGKNQRNVNSIRQYIMSLYGMHA